MMNFLDYLETGSHQGPFMGGAIGTSFLTPDQHYFRSMRRRYGESELDAGSFPLTQVHFDKESGTTSVGQLDTGPSSWYGTPHKDYTSCDCRGDANCCG